MRERKGTIKIGILWFSSLCMLLGMMLLIYRFSAANSVQSSHLSQGLSYRLVCFFRELCPGLASEEALMKLVEFIETPIRKMAHFTEYTILGWLMQLHLRTICFLQVPGKEEAGYHDRRRLPWTGILLGVLYAVTDEIHQYFVPGRACRCMDVCIDSLGVITGSLIFLLIFRHLLDGILRKG